MGHWVLVVIIVTALTLIALAFFDGFRPVVRFSGIFPLIGFAKTLKAAEKKNRIDIVREAAFAVVEASLEAEPEKWKAVKAKHKGPPGLIGYDPPLMAWLYNLEAGLAVWIRNGPNRLFLLKRVEGLPFDTDNGEKIYPPASMKSAIYQAAMKIVGQRLEEQEQKKLSKMVEAFKPIKQEEGNNDAETA